MNDNKSFNNGNGTTADGVKKGKKAWKDMSYPERVEHVSELFAAVYGRMNARAGRDQRYAEKLHETLSISWEDFLSVNESFGARERVEKPHWQLLWDLINGLNEAELPVLIVDLDSFNMKEVEELGLTVELNDARTDIADGKLPIGKRVLAGVNFRRTFSATKAGAEQRNNKAIADRILAGAQKAAFRPGRFGWKQQPRQPEAVTVVGLAPASADALSAQEELMTETAEALENGGLSTAPAGQALSDPAHPLVAVKVAPPPQQKKQGKKSGGRPRHGEDTEGFEGNLRSNRQRQQGRRE